MLEPLAKVLVLANSASSRRGLCSLLREELGFEVTESLDWNTKPSQDYDLILGELEGDTDPARLEEPFLVLSDEVTLEPGPGRGQLATSASEHQILVALQAVYLGLSVRDDYHLQDNNSTDELHDLTAREIDVLGLLGEGHTNRQIGEALHISENTVKFHLSSIFSKLGVGSRAEAVTVGLRCGIILL